MWPWNRDAAGPAGEAAGGERSLIVGVAAGAERIAMVRLLCLRRCGAARRARG
jgi:hypothetical protein